MSAVNWRELPAGEHRLSCPNCGRGAKDRTLGTTIDHEGRGIARCFRCDFVEVNRQNRPERNHQPPAQRPQASTPRVVAAPPKRTTLSPEGLRLWQSSRPITPTSYAGAYLLARKCVLPPAGSDLRELPLHRHPSGYVGTVMVALLTDFATGEPRSLHFTWLGPDGHKADVTPPRLLLAGHAKAGAVCRLWPDDEVLAGLGLAEGIETALSLAHAFQPVWAAIDASNLAALEPLPGIESLVVAQDRDPTGERAARALANRWAAAGREVLLTRQAQNDINDLVTEVACV